MAGKANADAQDKKQRRGNLSDSTPLLEVARDRIELSTS